MHSCTDLGLPLPVYWWVTLQRRKQKSASCYVSFLYHIGGTGSKLLPIWKPYLYWASVTQGSLKHPRSSHLYNEIIMRDAKDICKDCLCTLWTYMLCLSFTVKVKLLWSGELFWLFKWRWCAHLSIHASFSYELLRGAGMAQTHCTHSYFFRDPWS